MSLTSRVFFYKQKQKHTDEMFIRAVESSSPLFIPLTINSIEKENWKIRSMKFLSVLLSTHSVSVFFFLLQ